MALPSNEQLLTLWLKGQPNLQNRLALTPKEILSERGYAAMERNAPGVMSDFIQAHVTWALNMIMPARVRSWWRRYDCTETFFQPYGEVAQRLYGTTATEVSPGFLNLKNGDVRSPWITSYPEVSEDMYRKNDNYQGLLTNRRDRAKMIFLRPNGIAELLSTMLQGLSNSFALHEDAVLDECEYAMLTDSRLTGQQVVTVPAISKDSPESARAALSIINDVLMEMESESVNNGWNMAGHDTIQDKDRLRLIVRPWVMSLLKSYTYPDTRHPDYLNLGVKICPKNNFGGTYYTAGSDVSGATEGARLYPVYTADELKSPIQAPEGRRGIGLGIAENTSGAGNVVAYSGDDNVNLVDPLINVPFVLQDKGAIWSNFTTPYHVDPYGPNPRTLQTQYWANCEDIGRHYDRHYTCVKFVMEATSNARRAK